MVITTPAITVSTHRVSGEPAPDTALDQRIPAAPGGLLQVDVDLGAEARADRVSLEVRAHDADEVWAAITKDPAIRYSALAPNLRGARRALDAGFTEVEAVVSASDTHNRKNVNRSTAQSLDEIAVMIDEAHQRGATLQVVVATAWGCPYEGDVPVERVLAVAGRAVADGAEGHAVEFWNIGTE